MEEVYLLLLFQHHLSQVNSLPVPRVCMTEINPRAIVRVLPATPRPVDTDIRRGTVLERHGETERWRVQNRMDYDKRNRKRINERGRQLVVKIL